MQNINAQWGPRAPLQTKKGAAARVFRSKVNLVLERACLPGCKEHDGNGGPAKCLEVGQAYVTAGDI